MAWGRTHKPLLSFWIQGWNFLTDFLTYGDKVLIIIIIIVQQSHGKNLAKLHQWVQCGPHPEKIYKLFLMVSKEIKLNEVIVASLSLDILSTIWACLVLAKVLYAL